MKTICKFFPLSMLVIIFMLTAFGFGPSCYAKPFLSTELFERFDHLPNARAEGTCITGSSRLSVTDTNYSAFLCPPKDLTATTDDNEVTLTWKKPCTAECYIYDDGSMENAFAINPGNNVWMGNKFPVQDGYSCTLKAFDMQWWNNEAATNQDFQIDVYNLPGTLLGSSQLFHIPIPAPSGYWRLTLANGIPIDGPFYAMIHWNMFTGATHYLGYDRNGPHASENLAYGYNGDSFIAWTCFGANEVDGIFCLRACTFDNEEKKMVLLLPETKKEGTSMKQNVIPSVGIISSSLDDHSKKPTCSVSETDLLLSASGLTGYNIYQNSETTPIQYIPGPNILTTKIAGVTAGTSTYGIKAKYNLAAYGFPGQYGESVLEGPVTVDVPNVPETRIVQYRDVAFDETVCYDATRTISVAGFCSFFTIDGGSATLIAGQKISFLPDVVVRFGGYMHGYIAPAGPYCASLPAVNILDNAVDKKSDPFSAQPSFKIYPNPTTEHFVVVQPGQAVSKDWKVELVSTMGDKILSEELSMERQHEFSLSGWPPGIYFIRVTSGNRTETGKIIKQ